MPLLLLISDVYGRFDLSSQVLNSTLSKKSCHTHTPTTSEDLWGITERALRCGYDLRSFCFLGHNMREVHMICVILSSYKILVILILGDLVVQQKHVILSTSVAQKNCLQTYLHALVCFADWLTLGHTHLYKFTQVSKL